MLLKCKKKTTIVSYVRFVFEEKSHMEITLLSRCHIFQIAFFQNVFVHAKIQSPHLWIPPVWRAILKSSVFVSTSVDGWPNHRNKAVFSNFSSIMVIRSYFFGRFIYRSIPCFSILAIDDPGTPTEEEPGTPNTLQPVELIRTRSRKGGRYTSTSCCWVAFYGIKAAPYENTAFIVTFIWWQVTNFGCIHYCKIYNHFTLHVRQFRVPHESSAS